MGWRESLIYDTAAAVATLDRREKRQRVDGEVEDLRGGEWEDSGCV